MLSSRYLGLIAYDEAYRLQRDLWEQRVAGVIPDQLLLLEHPPVITLGSGARECNLLISPERLAELGVQLREVDRGGDVTYHGLGQLIGYPIIDLQPERMDVLRYLRDLEEVLIRTLRRFDLTGVRKPGFTGVWVEDRKIASIGVKISRWVTYHGFALNVTTDLSAYDLIVPCGIAGVTMTSMRQEFGQVIPLQEVAAGITEEMNAIFQRELPTEREIPAYITS
jgi:lipoate-protein ligase B